VGTTKWIMAHAVCRVGDSQMRMHILTT